MDRNLCALEYQTQEGAIDNGDPVGEQVYSFDWNVTKKKTKKR